MHSDLKLFLQLLRAGTLGEALELNRLPESFDVKNTAALAQRHDVVLPIWAALSGAEDPALLRLKTALRSSYGLAFAKSVNQEIEGTALLDELERAGMDCIPLKGWVLRQYYADPLNRSMADLDILMCDYRYEEIKKSLEAIGYEACGESAWKHDEFIKRPYMHVEVHKRLTDNSGIIREWERQIWKRGIPVEGTAHRFAMCPADFLVFHLVHMYKDFKNGALGFRRLTDLWLLLRNIKGEELEDAEAILDSMNLGRFFERMRQLVQVCFEDAEPDENSALLLRFAAEGAVYTTVKRYQLGRMAAFSGKTARDARSRSLLGAVFLPYERMKTQYPAVEKHPVLLPWFWVVRILRHAAHPGNKMKKLNSRWITEQQYQEMKKVFRAGGLSPEEGAKIELV